MIEESDAIMEATGNAPLPYASLLLAAWRGSDAQASALVEAAGRQATSWGDGADASL